MITLWWGKQEKLYGNHCWPLPLKCHLATLQTRASNPVGNLRTRSKSVRALPEWVSINNCPNKALIQNANISSLFSMWNSHWCKWKYHVCRQCKRYLQHGSREGILPAVLRNLNHSSSPRTSGCGKKKKKVAHILCENHTIHHLKTFWTGIGLFFNCQAEEVKKLDGFCTVTENEVYQIK